MKHQSIMLSVVGLALALTSCDDKKEVTIIDEEQPIKTSTLYMTGDATPSGWNIDAPDAFTVSATDPNVFTWEGKLIKGQLKCCLEPGSWDVPFIRPVDDGQQIGKEGLDNVPFQMHAGDPDEKWQVVAAGMYRLEFNMKTTKMSATYLSELANEPIVTDALYIFGDATPCVWDINNPTQLKKESQYVFSYEGVLVPGQIQGVTKTGTWDQPLLIPDQDDVTLSDTGVYESKMMYANQNQIYWKVATKGNYRLTFDLEHYTMKSEYLGASEEPAKEAIETETLYMVGDAAPCGWEIANPTPLTRDSKYIFSYEGRMYPGQIQLVLQGGSWDQPLIVPDTKENTIAAEGTFSSGFVYGGTSDMAWHFAANGIYRIVFDLENYTMTAEYKGEPEATPIVPIETETLYIVGDAAPCGWDIAAPTLLKKESQYIFSYEGALNAGELKACATTGDWGVPFVRPSNDAVTISDKGVSDPSFIYEANPDYKWKVTVAGNYRLVFDLEHYTIEAKPL